MRAFSFSGRANGGVVPRRPPRRGSLGPAGCAPHFSPFSLLLLLPLVLAAVGPGSAWAQWPPELRGEVRDGVTGAPVAEAWVEIRGLRLGAETDGSGSFRITGLVPGRYELRVGRMGYLDATALVSARNGHVSTLTIRLDPAPLLLPGVGVAVASTRAEAFIIERADLPPGARTLGDVLAQAPGVVVTRRGPAGGETVSIRGGAADAVLVLVDGAPLNDPISGEADLSSVPATSVESVVVLRGGRSAALGPRAEAGAILVRTRPPSEGVSGSTRAGSLGLVGGAGEAGLGVGGAVVGIGLDLERLDGGFSFKGTSGEEGVLERGNADVARAAVRATGESAFWGGDLIARLSLEDVERGLPGRSYAPSPQARQSVRLGRGSLYWRREQSSSLSQATLFTSLQRTRFRDPSPPLGLAYDDTARVLAVGGRLEGRRLRPGSPVESVGGGIDIQHQRIATTVLAKDAPRSRTDLGVFADAVTRLPLRDLRLAVAGRLNRDPVSGSWWHSHDLTLTVPVRLGALHLSQRSSFSPPSLADQFFQEGVGVAPNPDLGPERVPSEWEVGLSLGGDLGTWTALAGANVYRGDVHGMIIWAPDFRFVWSPRNVDVRRWGVELWGHTASSRAGVSIGGSYAFSSVLYDWPGSRDSVQVAYRPRHVADLSLRWMGSGWDLEGGGRYIGVRYPVPAPINALPGFWTLDLYVARQIRMGSLVVTPSLHVDRLLDNTDSMIHGFPEPGRTFLFELHLGPAARSPRGEPRGASHNQGSRNRI